MKISYRRGDTSNLDEVRFIAEINSKIPPIHNSDFRSDEETIQREIDFILSKISENDFFEVAMAFEDQIVGFHIVRKVPYMRGIFAGAVYTLWVDPQYRNNGIGTALKQHGEDWARAMNLDHVCTWISSKNQQSISLNEQLGYEITNYKLRKKI